MKQPLWTKNFLGVSISSFFIFLVFYLLMVTLPVYTLEDLNGSAADIGLVVTIFLIGAVIVRPFSGIWIEQIGRKKMLFFSLIIILLSTFLYVFSTSLIILLVMRFIHGVGFGIATTATGTIAADLIHDERRGEGMGYYATFMNMAMVIGPFLGLTMIQMTNFTVLFIVCTILGAFAFFAASIISIPTKNPIGESMPLIQFSVKDLFEKSALPISLVAASLAVAYSSILSFISVYAQELDMVAAASFFFVVYAVFLIISRPFTGRWFDQYGDNFLIYPSILLFAIGIFMLSQATNSFIFLFSGAFIGVGIGTLTSSLQAIVIRNAPPNRRGMATATFFTFFDLGIGGGSYILGLVAIRSGYGKLYLMISFFVIGCIALYYLLHGRLQKQQSHMNN